jgi:hypothetical protein
MDRGASSCRTATRRGQQEANLKTRSTSWEEPICRGRTQIDLPSDQIKGATMELQQQLKGKGRGNYRRR